MNLETRDQLDTYLDDARQALMKAGTLLMSTEMRPDIDWAIYGRVVAASNEVLQAINALPTVHSLQASR